MTQQTYRANLSSAVFPMTLAKAGRSVIVPTIDQNFDRRVDPAGDNTKAVGIPQVVYMENVLPTPDGFQSVGLKPRTSITTPGSIKALQQVYFATATTTTSSSPTISYSDTGATLSNWTQSTNIGTDANGAVSLVASDAVVGNPVNSYRLTYKGWALLETGEGAGWHGYFYPNWMKRDFGITNSNTITVVFDFYFNGADPSERFLDFGFGVTTDNLGPRIIYDSVNNGTPNFKLWCNVGFSVPGEFGTREEIAVGNVATPLAYNTWYTATLVRTVSTEGTVTITCTIKNAALTVFATVNGVIPVTKPKGGYCYFQHSPNAEGEEIQQIGVDSNTLGYNNSILNLDNFTLSGDITTNSNTTFSGVNTLYIAYHSDNTATWSYSLDVWTNNPVTEGGGFASPLSDSLVSYGFARGRGFICVRIGATTKIYELSITGGTTLVFTEVTTTISTTLPFGESINNVVGITSSYNYLILYTASTTYWSSTTTPTDFAISLVSGAGNEIPNNLKGDITFCREHLAGFSIYTPKNAVFAQYTGNSKYPWKFREIAGSSGYTYSTQVAGSTNADSQYGLSDTKYIQEIQPGGAGLISKEVTDFISTQTHWDNWDSATNLFSVSSSGTVLDSTQPRILFVLDRYIIVPYGFVSSKYTYALVFDILNKRYGKFKATFTTIVSDDRDFYFVDYLLGTVSRAYFDIYDQVISGGGQYKHNGVLILGKFQYVRAKLIQLEEIEIESPQSTTVLPAPTDQQFTIAVLPSLNGKIFSTPVVPTKDTNSTQTWLHYYCPQIVGVNHSIALKGAFDVNTLLMDFTVHGNS